MERILAHTKHNGFLVVDLQTGATLSSLKGASGGTPYKAVFFGACPVFTSTGACSSFLAVCDSLRPFLHIFRIHHGDAPLRSFSIPERLAAICFSGCGSLILAGGFSGNVYCWDVTSGLLLRGHYKAVVALGMSPDGSRLISSGEDSCVLCYDMADVLDQCHPDVPPQPSCRWTSHALAITTMAGFWLGDGDFAVITSSADRMVHVHLPCLVDPLASFLLPTAAKHICVNPTLLECYAACSDGKIYVLELRNLVDGLCGTFLAKSSSGAPKVINSTTASAFVGHTGPVNCCSSNSDGTILVSCGLDGIRIWDINSRQTTCHLSALGDNLLTVSTFTDTTSHRLQSTSTGAQDHEAVSMSQVPPGVMKPLQRTWTNVLPAPIVLAHNPEAQIQQEVDQLIPNLTQLRLGLPSSADVECSRLVEIQHLAADIEVECKANESAQLQKERHDFGELVRDMFAALCEIPAESNPRTNQSELDDNDKFYVSALPVPPIDPYSAAAALRASRSSRRLFRYMDRSFARTMVPRPMMSEAVVSPVSRLDAKDVESADDAESVSSEKEMHTSDEEDISAGVLVSESDGDKEVPPGTDAVISSISIPNRRQISSDESCSTKRRRQSIQVIVDAGPSRRKKFREAEKQEQQQKIVNSENLSGRRSNVKSRLVWQEDDSPVSVSHLQSSSPSQDDISTKADTMDICSTVHGEKSAYHKLADQTKNNAGGPTESPVHSEWSMADSKLSYSSSRRRTHPKLLNAHSRRLCRLQRLSFSVRSSSASIAAE